MCAFNIFSFFRYIENNLFDQERHHSWSLRCFDLGCYLGGPLMASWALFGASLGLLKLLESCLESLGSNLGTKKAPKRYPNRPPKQHKSLSKRVPQATAHWVQMPINLDRNFHEVKEFRKSAHPLKISILNVFYDGFLRVAFFALACIGSAKHRWNATKIHRWLSKISHKKTKVRPCFEPKLHCFST